MEIKQFYYCHRDRIIHASYWTSIGIAGYLATQVFDIKDTNTIIYSVIISNTWPFFALLSFTSFLAAIIFDVQLKKTTELWKMSIYHLFKKIALYSCKQSSQSCVTAMTTMAGALIAIGLHMHMYDHKFYLDFKFCQALFNTFCFLTIFLLLNIISNQFPSQKK